MLMVPQGERRSADVIGNAVKAMRIVTGEEEEEFWLLFFPFPLVLFSRHPGQA